MKNLKPLVKESSNIIEQKSVNQLVEIVSKNSCVIIDVRNPKDINSQGGISGAVNIPSEDIEFSVDKQNSNFNPIFNDKRPFLFYCTGGVMSYVAALKAKEKGLHKVYNLEGGFAAWKKYHEVKITS